MTQLDQSLINTLQGFIDGANKSLAGGDIQNAMNYVNLYYESQTDFRAYASDALQVINNIGQF